MLTHVPLQDIQERHLEGLLLALQIVPDDVRLEAKHFLGAIAAGTMRLFEWRDGMVIISERDNRLVLETFCCEPGISMELVRSLTADLAQIAADWKCDTIETTVFNPHLASVIQKLGGRVESTTLTLAVE